MTEINPMVSIVCTNFNKGVFIKQAIDSFLSQDTKFDFEIIIIDDASTDVSKKIIEDYSRKIHNIKAIYNKKNLGITKTWIKACKFAKGKYIARCDGDDYWIDKHKLQKQIEQLEKNKNSKWSTTDFNMVDVDGKVINYSVFENNLHTISTTYEEILSTKGFTNPSSWLIDTKLMIEINEVIDKNAVDDTFNIQLELFQRTNLNYLPIAASAYRFLTESVSRTTNTVKAKTRINKLLKTQLEYLDKYKNVSFFEMTKFALKLIAVNEEVAVDFKDKIKTLQSNIDQQKATIDQQKATIDQQKATIDDLQATRIYKLTQKASTIKKKLKGLDNK